MVDSKFVASSPESVGVDSDRLEAVFGRAARDIEAGKLPGAQIAVARHGKIAGLRTFGVAGEIGSGALANDQTLYCIYSATKGVIAVAIWILIEENLLRIEEKVADIIPEFHSNEKGSITVEQLLLHTCGFPYAPLGPPDWEIREARLAAFSRWRLNWEPGSRFEYHPASAHWVLAEIIEHRSGVPYRDFIRSRITSVLGLDELFVGLPEQYDSRVSHVTQMAPAVPPPGGWRGVSPDVLLVFNEPSARRVGVPGGGGITGAAELALLYQTLIHRGEDVFGRRILKPETIDYCTQVRTADEHIDPLLRVPVNRALSMVVAGDDGKAHLRGFGRTTSARAFGHAGAGGQIAWGDPETDISLGYVTNGLGDWIDNGRRTTALSSLAAQCAID